MGKPNHEEPLPIARVIHECHLVRDDELGNKGELLVWEIEETEECKPRDPWRLDLEVMPRDFSIRVNSLHRRHQMSLKNMSKMWPKEIRISSFATALGKRVPISLGRLVGINPLMSHSKLMEVLELEEENFVKGEEFHSSKNCTGRRPSYACSILLINLARAFLWNWMIESWMAGQDHKWAKSSWRLWQSKHIQSGS